MDSTESITPTSKNNSRSIIKVLQKPVSESSSATITSDAMSNDVDICEVPSTAITMEQFFDGGDGNMVEIITDANSTDYIYENVIETIGVSEDDDPSDDNGNDGVLILKGRKPSTAVSVATMDDGSQHIESGLSEKSAEFTMSDQAFGQEADPDSAQILIAAANESLNRMKAKLESVSRGC